MAIDTISDDRLKLPKNLMENLKKSRDRLGVLELTVRNMERARLPTAKEKRDELEKLKQDIDAVITVYG